MEETFVTNNNEETVDLGEKFSGQVKEGGVILLHGDLGAGKTTFVQGLAKGLGIKRRITSPTFIIVRTYPENNFYHIDLYRMESPQDIQGLGLDEILKDKRNVVAIEWPEKIETLLPKKRININFEYLEENKRRIKINE